MNTRANIQKTKKRRATRTRAKIFGSAKTPRLSVFRSNRFMYAQLIDDEEGKTVASASSRETKADAGKKKSDVARVVGARIAKKAKELGVSKVVFDRRHYRYHGRVRAVAEGAREEGLII